MLSVSVTSSLRTVTVTVQPEPRTVFPSVCVRIVGGRPAGTLDIRGLNIGGDTGVALIEAAGVIFGVSGDAVTAIDKIRCLLRVA